jgi:hypothetical protein
MRFLLGKEAVTATVLTKKRRPAKVRVERSGLSASGEPAGCHGPGSTYGCGREADGEGRGPERSNPALSGERVLVLTRAVFRWWRSGRGGRSGPEFCLKGNGQPQFCQQTAVGTVV